MKTNADKYYKSTNKLNRVYQMHISDELVRQLKRVIFGTKYYGQTAYTHKYNVKCVDSNAVLEKG